MNGIKKQPMNSFKIALHQEFQNNRLNQFGTENYDEYRYGKLYPDEISKIIGETKRLIKKNTGYETQKTKQAIDATITQGWKDLEIYDDRLSFLYEYLDDDGKNLIVKLIAYRVLGFRKIKLPTNTDQYWKLIEVARSLRVSNDIYDPHFMHFLLQKFDLKKIGYDICIYFGDAGIVTDFMMQQYCFTKNSNEVIVAEKGDTVLDFGGCWGDTALYFASKVGKEGKVYSFEFVPDNIKLFEINKNLNPNLSDQIEIVPHPVWNYSDQTIYFKDNGPGSRIEHHPFDEQTGHTTTISIDDFVRQRELTNVDFIKMDIEGAEPRALEGGIETIRKFKPKLAISTYHSLGDFVNIPKWILDLDLGYEIFIGHYTIHSEETVCFAKIKER